jgi:hypothetical protein
MAKIKTCVVFGITGLLAHDQNLTRRCGCVSELEREIVEAD